MRLKLTPLAWSLGFGVGAAVAIALGPSAPRWGMALAFPSAALLLSIGALKERVGQEMRHLVRFALAFTIAFLAVHVSLGFVALAQMIELAGEDPEALARAELVRQAAMARWTVMALAIPGSALTLFALWRRDTQAPRPVRS